MENKINQYLIPDLSKIVLSYLDDTWIKNFNIVMWEFRVRMQQITLRQQRVQRVEFLEIKYRHYPVYWNCVPFWKLKHWMDSKYSDLLFSIRKYSELQGWCCENLVPRHNI